MTCERRRASSTTRQKTRRPSSERRGVCSPLLAAALVLACDAHGAPATPATAATVAALADLSGGSFERTTLPRLAVPQRHARCTNARDDRLQDLIRACWTGRRRPLPTGALFSFRARARRTSQEQGDAAALEAGAIFDLTHAAGTTSSLSSAIAALEEACRLVVRCHDIRVDLSAAYLTRGVLTSDGSDALAAIDAASAALRERPASAVARFNLALALEAAGMPDAAAREWAQVVADEDDASWRAEAEEHARVAQRLAVSRPAQARPTTAPAWAALVNDEPQRARQIGFDASMAEWGRAILDAHADAATKALEHAARVGQLLAARQGDRTIEMAVDAVHEADARERRLLGVAHAQYLVMVQSYEASEYEHAQAVADSILGAHPRSPSLVAWTVFYRTSATLHLHTAKQSLLAYRTLLDVPAVRELPALRGRLLWGMTTASLRDGAFDDARRYARQAKALFQSLGEREHLGAVQYLEAAALVEGGNEREMYGAIVTSVRALADFRRSNWLRSALAVGASACATRYPYAAAAMRHEAVSIAMQGGNALEIASALVARARSREWLGDTSGTASDTQRADSILDATGDRGASRWIRADVLSMRARAMMREGLLSEARSVLDSAEGLLRKTAVPTRLLSVAVARADVATREGVSNLPALENAERLTAKIEGRLTTRQATADYVQAAGAVRDRLVIAYLRGHRPWDAMAMVEARRGARAPWSHGASEEQRAARLLPRRGAAILSLQSIGDTLLGFLITTSGLRVIDTRIARDSLLRVARRVQSGMERHASATWLRGDLEWMYERLLAPSLRALDSDVVRLRLVVSGDLANVPYAALIDRSTGHHLVENFTISVHPALTDALDVSRDSSPSEAASLALIVDPAFPLDSFPSLGRLPGALREADLLPSLYAKSVVLSADSATPERVLRTLPTVSVAQVSAHAVVDERDAERSVLVLAKSPASDRPSSIDAATIRHLPLHQLQLVVLASCRSGMTGGGSGAGMLGLAAAFREAGTHGVVGALWAIDDGAAARFAERLHRAFRISGDGAGALRTAQLAMLKSTDERERSVAAWGAFTFTGH